MRHSRHPVLTMLAVAFAGSVVGIGLHLWLEPWTSVATIAAGAAAGMIVSHGTDASVALGLALGAGGALLVLGVRALAVIAIGSHHAFRLGGVRRRV